MAKYLSGYKPNDRWVLCLQKCMKKCIKCGIMKPLTEYYKNKRNKKDGTRHDCKTCHRIINKEWDRNNKDKRGAKRVVLWREEKKANGTYTEWYRSMRKQQEIKHREQYLVRCKIANALRRGKITRQGCQICGETKTHFHHTNYGQPFLVYELCDKHHKEAHKDTKVLQNISILDYSK